MRNDRSLQARARTLRNNSTDAERAMWSHLKRSQMEGVKLRRQQPIEDYIVDFVSFDPKLVIELDGGQHSENQEYDEKRDACLRENGFEVLRFWNNEVMGNMEGVLEVIRRCCLLMSPPPPAPPARGWVDRDGPSRGEGEV